MLLIAARLWLALGQLSGPRRRYESWLWALRVRETARAISRSLCQIPGRRTAGIPVREFRVPDPGSGLRDRLDDLVVLRFGEQLQRGCPQVSLGPQRQEKRSKSLVVWSLHVDD